MASRKFTRSNLQSDARAKEEIQLSDTRQQSVDMSSPASEGDLLAVTPDGVIGWGRSLEEPAKPLHVILLVNQIPAGVALADRFDIDLVRSRAGPGIPGFVISLRSQFLQHYPLHIELRSLDGQVLGSPLIFNDDREILYSIEAEDGQYEGMVDGLRDGVLHGWARSVTQPDRPIVIELFDGEERIDRQLANLYRADIQAAGKGQGKCAFAFDVPISILDGCQHSLHLKVAGTKFELRNSPLSFGQLTASSLIDELIKLRQETKRLAVLVHKVVSPSGTLQTELVRVLSERVSALTDIQRDMVERELDALRKLAFDPSRVSIPKTARSDSGEAIDARPVARKKNH